MTDSDEPLSIACTLDQAGLQGRIREMSAMGAALRALELDLAGERPAARLSFPPRARERVERFVAAESACCAFFRFRISGRDDRIELHAEVPREEAAIQSLRGLAAAFMSPAPGGINAR